MGKVVISSRPRFANCLRHTIVTKKDSCKSRCSKRGGEVGVKEVELDKAMAGMRMRWSCPSRHDGKEFRVNTLLLTIITRISVNANMPTSYLRSL